MYYFALNLQIDTSFLVATRWIVPAGVAASGNIPNFFQVCFNFCCMIKQVSNFSGFRFRFDCISFDVGVLVLLSIWRIRQKKRRRRRASGSNR